MDNEIEILSKRIEQLERKVEIYFQLLKINNELDFIMNGTYLLDSEIQDVLDGEY